MAVDKFELAPNMLDMPFTAAVTVVPSDTVDLVNTTRGILIGVSGTLRVTMANGVNADIAGLQVGIIHRLRVTRVHLTGTSATSIVALS